MYGEAEAAHLYPEKKEKTMSDIGKVAFLSDGYTEEFCIPEGDDYPKVKGTFRPQTNLQALERATTAEKLADDDAAGLIRLTCGVLTEQIKSWDVVDEKGAEVTLTQPNVERLPAKLLEALFKAITRRTTKEAQADVKNS